MAEPKPLASLTSGLLARKGAAQPAMRRPMMGFGRAVPHPAGDDLGWNDMGLDVPAPAPVPLPMPVASSPPATPVAAPMAAPAVVMEQQRLAEWASEAPAAAPMRHPAAARRAAFTLRLDPERHLRLRLASTLEGRSAQQIVTDALDQFLKELPEIDRLAQQLPRDRGHG